MKAAPLTRLDYVIAAHMLDATPGLRLRDPRYAPGSVVVWIGEWMRRRTARLQDKAAAHAGSRPWRPWWPGARIHWPGNVACGCGDCRAYVMKGGEGPKQPAAWWEAGRIPK
jgi:hypothetical protein